VQLLAWWECRSDRDVWLRDMHFSGTLKHAKSKLALVVNK
jgi:hypothetical protein